MRRSIVVLGVATLFAGASIGCEQAADPLLLPFSGRLTGGSQNGQALAVFPNVVQISVGQIALLQTNAPLSLLNQVQWRSSHPTIAAISPSGRVTGIFPGVATITARFAFDTTQTATSIVTVLGVAGP